MSRSSMYTLFWSLSLFSTLAGASVVNTNVFNDETRCQDGRRGIVSYIQHYVEHPFQPAIFTVDCGPPAGNQTNFSDELAPKSKRATSCASLGCSSACYGPGASPTVSDCNNLVAYLQNRGQQQSVASMQKVVVTSNTCLFRFTNNEYGAMELCDSTWASQSSSMAGQCLPQAPGTLCTASGFTLDVCVNSADMPATTSTTTARPSTTTPTPNQQTTSNDSPTSTSTANAATSTPSLSGTTSLTNRTSSITISRSGTVGITGLVVPAISVDSSSASATIAQALGYQGSKGSQPNTPAIVGAIFGVLALILILVALWIWRRRARHQAEQTQTTGSALESEQQDPRLQIYPNTFLASPSTMVDRGAMPLVAGYGATKPGLSRYPIAPASEHSSSSLNHLMSPTQDSGSAPSTPATGTSVVDYSAVDLPAGNGRPEFEGRPRSISARSLAQAIAPNLSQVDINRLADTIVARMQAGAPIVTPQGDVLSGQSELGEDPPPPFRASWNGNEQRTPTA